MKLRYCLIAACAAAALHAAELLPALSIDKAGAIKIDSLSIQMLCFEPGWKAVFQDEKNVKADEGYPKQDDQMFRLKGSYSLPAAGKAFVLKQKAVKNGQSLTLDYIIESEAGIPVQDCMLLFSLPIESTKGRTLLFDDAKVVLPAEFSGKYPLPSTTARKVVIPLTGGNVLTVTAPVGLKTLIQDDREYKGNIYELRFSFSDQGGGKPVTKSTLSLTLTSSK